MQAFGAFDHGDVRAARIAGEGRENLGRRLGVEVEIVAWAPARALQPHRVDIVRPLLEGLDAEASLAERRCQPNRRASSCLTICGSPRGRDAPWDQAAAARRLLSRASHSAFARDFRPSATLAASPSARNAIASVPLDGGLAIFVGDFPPPYGAEPGEVHRLVRRLAGLGDQRRPPLFVKLVPDRRHHLARLMGTPLDLAAFAAEDREARLTQEDARAAMQRHVGGVEDPLQETAVRRTG